MIRFIQKALLSVLLPAAMLVMACGPADVETQVTPPAPVGGDGGDGDETPSGGDGVSLTVCTFNIRYANTSDTYPDGSSAAWTMRAPAVKKFFEATKPDLIGLQEVRKEQSQWFSSTLGSEYGYYDVSRDSSSGSSVASAGNEGVGILYRKDRFEVVQKDFFWLDTSLRSRPGQNSDGTYGEWHSACRRITVYMVLKDKNNNNALIYFLPTHYDHKSSDARKNAAALMVSQMQTMTKESDLKNAKVLVIHLGDLNTTYDSAELKPLNDSMNYARLSVDGNFRYTGTFNGFGNNDSLIDHVYYGGKSVKPLKYWVDKNNYGVPFLSDHYPVLFTLEY